MHLLAFSKCSLFMALASSVSALTATQAAEIAPYLNVHINTLNELMNTNDFASIDATKWAVPFNQSVEVLATWEPHTKTRMFGMMQELLNIEPELQTRAQTPQSAKAIITSKEAIFKSMITSEEEAKSLCKTKSPRTCRLCVTAAGFTAFGISAGCGVIALGALAAATVGTAGTATPAVTIIAFSGCIAAPAAAFLTAVIACEKLTN